MKFCPTKNQIDQCVGSDIADIVSNLLSCNTGHNDWAYVSRCHIEYKIGLAYGQKINQVKQSLAGSCCAYRSSTLHQLSMAGIYVGWDNESVQEDKKW